MLIPFHKPNGQRNDCQGNKIHSFGRHSVSVKRKQGLTLVELLVLIAVVAIFFSMIDFGAPDHAKARALRIQCVYNLKQEGLAARVWAGDNGDKFPWDIPGTNGGTMEFMSGPNLWRNFQILSNELSTPKVLICPADELRLVAATNFTFLNNSNISFFLSVDATNGDFPLSILSGDYNLTNGTPVQNGILTLTPNHAAGWTAEVHKKVGNILLTDGSVQQLSSGNLEMMITSETIQTNRLLMPALNP